MTTLPNLSDEQIAERFAKSEEAQRRFFIRYGLAVVPTRGKVPGLSRLIQMAVEGWCRIRFGLVAG